MDDDHNEEGLTQCPVCSEYSADSQWEPPEGADDAVTCPSCGAVSFIDELLPQ